MCSGIPAVRLLRHVCWLLVAALLLSGCSRSKPSLEQQLEDSIVAASRRHPEYNAKWDAVIRRLASIYVQNLITSRSSPERGPTAKQAVDAGCRDAFVRYIWYCHQDNYHDRSDQPSFAREIQDIVAEFQQAEYPAFLRAYAENRAYLLWYFNQDKKSPITHGFSQQNWQDVFATLNDPTTPEWLARLLASDIMDLWSRSEKRQELADRLAAAFKVRWGDCASIPLLRAQNALDLVRRQVYDRETIPELEKQPDGPSILVQTQADLEHAWKLDPSDPRIAAFMMELCRYRKLPREQLEEWFQRALATGKPAGGAALMKYYYLAPEWYGSLEEQLEFARSVYARPEYGSGTPLLPERAHREHVGHDRLDDDYYARPEVWADIQAAYRAYLGNYPDNLRERIKYVRYAWWARDWATLNEQLATIDLSLVSADRVGGQVVLDQILEDARAHGATAQRDARQSY